MSDAPWYQTFFDTAYYRLYAPHLKPARTDREVEGIVALLGLPPGSRILDLCCGYGRHTLPLAQRGYRMTGLDLSEDLLRRAEAEAQSTEVRWVRADMRQLPFAGEFDAVINIFTAFGYLEDEEEDEQVLRQVARALRPGGVFLLETMHRDALLRRFQPHGVVRGPDGTLELQERRIDLPSSRIETRVTLIEPDGQRSEHVQSLRLYTLRELTRMCEAAGLTVHAHYGGLDGQPLTLESGRLALLARKVP